MEKILELSDVNTYVSYVGASVLHPLLGIVHYDELDRCRHALIDYGVYALFLMKESPYTISYGSGRYSFGSGSLMCVAPGQRGGLMDNGEIIHIKGWALLFHPDLLRGTHLERKIRDYQYFSYYSNEALRPSPQEWDRLEMCITEIRSELSDSPDDGHLRTIVISYLAVLLELAARFYERQLGAESRINQDITRRLDTVLERYFAQGTHRSEGIPTVRYCASQLFLSPNYFGDLVRARTGESATQYIRHYLMHRARTMLRDGLPVGEVSEALGFEYPQHFTRMFKKEFGLAPSKIGDL